MRRRIGREELSSVSPFSEQELQGFFLWTVYEDFDIIEQDEQIPFFKATTHKGKTYRPFVDTPHLLLEFARLVEHKGHPYEALDDWISKYGLLGLSRQDPHRLDLVPDVQLVPEVEWVPEIDTPPLRYDDAGGPGDTFHAYFFEASKANKLLTLYEAVLNQDINNLEQCFALHEGCTQEALREKWGSELEKAQEKNLDHEERVYFVREVLDDMLVYPSLPTKWETYLMNRALLDVWEGVGAALSIFAYPSITSADGSGPLTPNKLTSTWRARNLLGALYLQFFWLITSAGELSRCKHCNRIISYAPPMEGSEKRKPRKDKKFCSERCRQNYHYQNRTKPRRRSS